MLKGLTDPYFGQCTASSGISAMVQGPMHPWSLDAFRPHDQGVTRKEAHSPLVVATVSQHCEKANDFVRYPVAASEKLVSGGHRFAQNLEMSAIPRKRRPVSQTALLRFVPGADMEASAG